MTVTVSTPFRVQVRAPGTASARPPLASIDNFAYEGRRALPNPFIDPQTGQRGGIYFGKHTNFQFCPDDGKIYGYGGDGGYVGTGSNQSSAIHLARIALDGDLNLTYDNPYPWWGIPGRPFPVGQDNCPFMYDSTRGCFWIAGGYYAGAGEPNYDDPRIVGNKQRYGIWRFWTRGPQAGNYELVQPYPGSNPPAPPDNAHGEGMGGSYVPGIDCLVWMGYGTIGNIKKLAWYHCASGRSGLCDTGAYAESTPIFPNVAVGAESPAIVEYPTVYDPVKNELIWQYCGAGRQGHGGIYATKLDNWPGALTTRQLWWGWINGISSIFGQSPMWIRGRKLYVMTIPFGYGGTGVGNGLGIWELELEAPNTMRQASMPQFEDRTGSYPYYPSYPVNEGAYDPVRDAFFGTNVAGSTFVFRYSPPSWTPAAGNVKAITVDSRGDAVNSMSSVAPPRGIYYAMNGNPLAWASACYARDLSTNGAMLINNGGDGDYWGTEVYCFDFDTRKWVRLSEPTTSMSGNTTADKARSPSDPLYFSRAECEHGPAVPENVTGLLPAGTTPGVPHNYDGVMYLPGSVVGNRRGALVRPHSQVVYTTDGTGRTHYFDLDEMRWGRFSANRGGPNQNPLISGQIPIIGYDKAAGRIYHAYGYLDLATRRHTNRAWVNRSSETKGCFDPVRRLWLMPRMGGFGEATSSTPGTLMACAVDSSSTFVELPFAFNAGSTAWLRGQAWQAGLEYFDDLDCFFFYCCGTGGTSSPTPGTPYATRQTIWKIQPPSSNPLSSPWTVTEITMPGVAVQASGVQGTYGRFFRAPPLKCLAFYNGPANGGRIYLYKPQGV